MKAIVYGLSHALQLADIEKPVPADDDVLVRVCAAAVNPLDGVDGSLRTRRRTSGVAAL